MKPWEASAQELMDKRLLGSLSPEEAAAFEAALTDPEFRAEWALRQDLHAAFVAEGRAGLRSDLQALDAAHFPAATAGRLRWVRSPWVWAAAAAVLLLLIVFLPRPEQALDPEALFAQHFRPYPNTIAVIPRDEGEVLDPIALAMNAYQRGDYPAAVAAFDAMPATRRRPDLQFYRSLALLASGRTAEALAGLEALHRTAGHAFERETRWYLALAYLRSQRPEAARPLLDQVAANPEHPEQKAAQAILQALAFRSE